MSAMKTRTIFDVDGRVLAHSNHRSLDDESVIQNVGVGQGTFPNWPNRWREWWKDGPLNLQVRQTAHCGIREFLPDFCRSQLCTVVHGHAVCNLRTRRSWVQILPGAPEFQDPFRTHRIACLAVM